MNRTQLASLAMATLMLAGCSSPVNQSVAASPSSSTADPAPPSAEPVRKTTPTPTPKPSSSLNSRGNLVMQGGMFGIIEDTTTGRNIVKFQVNAITPITCQARPYIPASPAENGQLIAVDMVVETTPELGESSYPKFTLSGYDFKYIAASGTTFNGNLGTVATYSCIEDADTFPVGGMGPGERIAAKVILDVPAAHGVLVMKAGFKGGFEYNF